MLATGGPNNKAGGPVGEAFYDMYQLEGQAGDTGILDARKVSAKVSRS